MRRRAIWIAGAIVFIAVAGATLAPLVATGHPSRGAGGIAVHVMARGRFVRRIHAEGYLKAAKATPITVPAGEVETGFRLAWIAGDGSRVRAGGIVARFDPADLEKTLADSRDDRTSAQRKADRTQATSGAARERLADDARLAQRERDHADVFANVDDQIFSRNEIIESSIDRELAARKSEHAEGKIRATDRQSRLETEIYSLQRSAAELRIRRAEAGLSMLQIAAPRDGILVLERDWRGDTMRVGDYAWRGEKIGEIPDFGAMEALVYVLEADAGGLEPGRSASVTLAARPDVSFQGSVTRVDALAKPLRRGLPVQYFEAVLSLDPPADMTLRPGQRVMAEIVLEDVGDALTVPRQAIFEKDGRKIAYRAEGRTFTPVEVKVGRYGIGTALIEKGLNVGDRVALRDPSLPASDLSTSAGRATPEKGP